MGAAWGVVSGKFIVVATGLLIASRIDQGKLQALVDPRAPLSAISHDFAERRHLIASPDAVQTRARHPISIGIGAGELSRGPLAISRIPLPDGADLVIGRDIIGAHALMIDTRRHEVSILEKADQARLPQHFDSIPMSVDDRGILRIRIMLNGHPEEASLDLAQREPLLFGTNFWRSAPVPSPASQADIRLGSVEMSMRVAETSSPSDTAATLGLFGFDGRVLVVDLPHGKLWIETGREF